jgi:hypothetical protein
MKNSDIKIDLKTIGPAIGKLFKRMGAYSAIIFFLIVAALYGYIVWRINVYSNAPASQSEVNAKVAAQPHIDPTVVQKMQALQNNSGNVQSLFNQARENPFQE